MADRSQFWQNVDATKPDKLSRLSVRQLRDYQNYFLEVQGDYNPALPPHENTVASERLTLLRDEIGSRRGKRRSGASVAERRHKQVLFWMKIGAAVAAVGVLVTILTLYRPSSPPSPPPQSEPNIPTTQPSAPHATPTPLVSSSITAMTAAPSSSVMSSPITPSPLAPVTFVDVIRVLSDTSLTDLQKDEYRRKHQGRTVEWTVRVLSVKRQTENKPDSDFVVVFGSSEAADIRNPPLGEMGVATFPANLRDDIVDLHSDETIRFRGVLNFIGPIHYTVVVNNCQLLEHHK